MNAQDIIALEEKIQTLAYEIETFRTEHRAALSQGHYGENYNYLGTLKVNTLSLQRKLDRLASGININC